MEDFGGLAPRRCDCVNQYSDKRTKLWSFEAKLLINRSNVRECFFRPYRTLRGPTSAIWSRLKSAVPTPLKELRMLSPLTASASLLDVDKPCRQPGADSGVSATRLIGTWPTGWLRRTDFLEYVKLV